MTNATVFSLVESAAVLSSGGSDWKLLFRSKPLLYLYAGYALFALSSNNLGIWGRRSSYAFTTSACSRSALPPASFRSPSASRR